MPLLKTKKTKQDIVDNVFRLMCKDPRPRQKSTKNYTFVSSTISTCDVAWAALMYGVIKKITNAGLFKDNSGRYYNIYLCNLIYPFHIISGHLICYFLNSKDMFFQTFNFFN